MIGAGLSLSTQPGMSSSQFRFKQCGSSIADYSDNALPSRSQPFQGFKDGPFTTQNHIIHPPAQRQAGTQGSVTFRSREVRGTPAPVFIPQAREIRINGSFLNSSRGFEQQPTPPPTSGLRAVPINNPFRSRSSKRPPISKFPSHQGQPGKFDFSRINSEEGGAYELQPIKPLGPPPQGRDKGDFLRAERLSSQFDLTVLPDTHMQDNRYRLFPQEYSSSPPGPFPEAHIGARQRGATLESEDSVDRSLHESPFLDLVSLDVAQRRAAERRASGRDDPSHVLRAHGNALRHATQNASFATNASSAGSPLTTPSAVATPANHRKVSRFIPRVLGRGVAYGHSYIRSPLATRSNGGSIDDAGKSRLSTHSRSTRACGMWPANLQPKKVA